MATVTTSGWQAFRKASGVLRTAIVSKWLGHLSALALFVIWGAFFLEHLQEWYFQSKGQYPPLWVSLAMVFDFAILLGLSLSSKWIAIGSGTVGAGTIGFATVLASHGDLRGTIMLINLVPLAFFGAWWMLKACSACTASDERSDPAKHSG